MAKTKIVVFRKGGHLAKNEFWTFGETAIEVVNTYKYLGLCFSAKWSTGAMGSELVMKAKLEVTLIIMFKSLWKHGWIPICSVWKDCQILPCVLYGAERGAWNWASACFCTKKVPKRCQPNSKHYGIWWNMTLSLVCHHCHKSCEILAASGNDVFRKTHKESI